MVWPMSKNKMGGHLAEKDEDKDKSGNNKSTTKGCAKCGERCKKCGADCRCRVRRIYVRAPMFNYYTDLMH